MLFEPFPELKTAKLELLKPTVKEWPGIVYLRSDPEVNRYVKRPLAETREKAIEFIEKALGNIENDHLVMWFIYAKAESEMIGTICLWNISEDRKTAEVGFDLKPAYHNKGLMNEALKIVIDYGFSSLSLELIEAFTSKMNESSKKLLIKNNFSLNKVRKDPENAENIIFELRRTN